MTYARSQRRYFGGLLSVSGSKIINPVRRFLDLATYVLLRAVSLIKNRVSAKRPQ